MSEQRPTPRSDSEQDAAHNIALWCDIGKRGFSHDDNGQVVPLSFARTLERELAETREMLVATTERLKALDPTNPQAQRAEELLGRIKG